MNINELKQLIREMTNSDASGFLAQLLILAIWILVIVIMTWLVRRQINKSITDNASRYRVKKIVRLVSYALIVIVSVISLTSQIQYFTIAIGLLSAGIAFALQEVILSVAGWIAIFFTNMYRPGDRIEIRDIKGDVIDIGITKTTLMEIGEWISSDNYSGRIVHVSNSNVFKGPVKNYSSDFPFLWDEVNIPIRFGSDLKLAHQLIMEVATNRLSTYIDVAQQHWNHMVTKYLIENAHVAPSLTFKLTDNWVEFNLRYVVDYKKRRSTRHDLFRDLQVAIQETGGKVELASATFEVTAVPEFRARVQHQAI